MHAPARYESDFCKLSIDAPAPRIVVLTIAGRDIGEFGSAPMDHIEEYLADGDPIELYIDARRTKGASIEVSNEWATWLGENRSRFDHVSMLTGSRFVQITAGFVRSFSDLQDVMRIYTEPAAFDEALAGSLVSASRN